MSLLPTDDKLRKGLPLLKQIGYFPKALREITKVSVVNNVRYNPERAPTDINWARGKSTDQLGSLFRHLYERVFGGVVFEPVPASTIEKTGIAKVYVLAELAWRALAALELEIEEQELADAVVETLEVSPISVSGQMQAYKDIADINESIDAMTRMPGIEAPASGTGATKLHDFFMPLGVGPLLSNVGD